MATVPNNPNPKQTGPHGSYQSTRSTAKVPGSATRSAAARRTQARVRGNQVFLFDRSNYMWILIGFACILLGFILMIGGKSADPHQFHYDEIYSFRRITLAPLLILAGFAIEAYAIMKRPATAVNEDAPDAGLPQA